MSALPIFLTLLTLASPIPVWPNFLVIAVSMFFFKPPAKITGFALSAAKHGLKGAMRLKTVATLFAGIALGATCFALFPLIFRALRLVLAHLR